MSTNKKISYKTIGSQWTWSRLAKLAEHAGHHKIFNTHILQSGPNIIDSPIKRKTLKEKERNIHLVMWEKDAMLLYDLWKFAGNVCFLSHRFYRGRYILIEQFGAIADITFMFWFQYYLAWVLYILFTVYCLFFTREWGNRTVPTNKSLQLKYLYLLFLIFI